MKINIKELEDVIVEISEMDQIIKERYKEIEETIFIGNDDKEELFVKVMGNFEVMSIESMKNINTDNTQELINAINNAIEKIKIARNNVIKEVLLEKTREN